MKQLRNGCLAAGLMVASAASALAAPAVTITPAAGPPTTKLTITGTGFTANAMVDFYFDTSDFCVVFADGTGKATCSIKVPADAQPQQHWISVAQRSNLTGASKAFTVRTDMGQFHGRNARHIGVNPFENTVNAGNVADLDLLWSAKFGGGIFNTAVVSGGVLYVADGNKLYALNATTGVPLAGFPATLGANVSNSVPAVGGGKVYVAAGGGLYAFDAITGAAVPGFPAALNFLASDSSPALALGNVYVSDNNGSLNAFNATTGAVVSGFPVTVAAGTTIVGSPTVAGGVVYVGANDGKVRAFDAMTGAAIPGFLVTTGGGIASTVAAAGSSGFVGSRDLNYYGFDLDVGTVLGGFPVATGNWIDGTPAVAAGKVIAGSADSKVYATFVSGGNAWTTTLDSPIHGSALVANGVVYVQSTFRIYALSLATGAILWSSANRDSFGQPSPTVANGIVYATSSTGNISAYSVNGLAPAARLPGGALGVKPALSALHPNRALKAGQPALATDIEE